MEGEGEGVDGGADESGWRATYRQSKRWLEVVFFLESFI
jgi:hypothetical protein